MLITQLQIQSLPTLDINHSFLSNLPWSITMLSMCLLMKSQIARHELHFIVVIPTSTSTHLTFPLNKWCHHHLAFPHYQMSLRMSPPSSPMSPYVSNPKRHCMLCVLLFDVQTPSQVFVIVGEFAMAQLTNNLHLT